MLINITNYIYYNQFIISLKYISFVNSCTIQLLTNQTTTKLHYNTDIQKFLIIYKTVFL